MTRLSGPMLAPRAGGAPRQAVVLLHGYGSDGADLIGLGAQWQDLLPEALFVSPNAPEVSAGNPQGYQWFALDPDRAASRALGIPLALPVIVDFLKALWEQTGLTARDTLLVGFSQGAMMALHVSLALEENLLGVVAFSGALEPPPGFATGSHASPPICIIHGDMDTVVSPQLSLAAVEALQARGLAVSLHISPGTGHGISPDGLAYASSFIAGLVAAA